MRTFPIDADRVRLISTGNVTPIPVWVELADGSRRPDPNGRQEVDEQGRGGYRVEVIAPADADDERDRTDVVEVTIFSKDAPDVGGFGEHLRFDNLMVNPGYLNKKTGALTSPRWSADGVKKVGAGKQQHQPQAA